VQALLMIANKYVMIFYVSEIYPNHLNMQIGFGKVNKARKKR